MDEGLPVAREIYAGILNVGRAAWRHVPLRESKISVGPVLGFVRRLISSIELPAPYAVRNNTGLPGSERSFVHDQTASSPPTTATPFSNCFAKVFFGISEGRFSCGNTHRLTRLSETQGSITMLPITWTSPSIRRMINTSPDRVPRPVRAEMFTWCDTSISLPPVS